MPATSPPRISSSSVDLANVNETFERDRDPATMVRWHVYVLAGVGHGTDVIVVASAHRPCHGRLDLGFPSIGCWPCTRAVVAGEDQRACRWSGSDKTECGLHL